MRHLYTDFIMNPGPHFLCFPPVAASQLVVSARQLPRLSAVKVVCVVALTAVVSSAFRQTD